VNCNNTSGLAKVAAGYDSFTSSCVRRPPQADSDTPKSGLFRWR